MDAEHDSTEKDQDCPHVDLFKLRSDHQQNPHKSNGDANPYRPSGPFFKKQNGHDDQQKRIGVENRDCVRIIDSAGTKNEKRRGAGHRQAADGLHPGAGRHQPGEAKAPDQKGQHQQAHPKKSKPGDQIGGKLLTQQFHDRPGKRRDDHADHDQDNSAECT